MENKQDHIQVIPVSPNNVAALQKISRDTFYEAFAPTNSEQNILQYMSAAFTKEKLTDELNNSSSKFFFALQADAVIGYLKINFGIAQTELQDPHGLEIERIYVASAFHGKGVAQLLYNKALEIAADRGAGYVWLGVWEENDRAIAFYKKSGFVEFHKHAFMLGDEKQTDIMMKKTLK